MCRILILDDDSEFGSSLAWTLRNANEEQRYEARDAVNFEEALSEAKKASDRSRPFDVFLIDQRLGPGLSGIEVMEILKRICPQSETIIFTGMEDPEEGLRAYKAGAFRYLPKPFKTEELLHILDSLSQYRKIQREREWLQVFSEIAERVLSCSTYQQASSIIAQEALRLGFQRARLYACSPANPDDLTGLSQAGINQVESFEGFHFSSASSPYLSQAMLSHEVRIFFGREFGSGMMESAYGNAFIPPVGEWVVLPLWIGEKLNGLMVLENTTNDRQIHEEERRQLQLFTRLVSGNLERTRLYEREWKNTQRLDLLQRASVELLNVANQDEEKFWLTLLTLATANYALAFNRAWVFLAEAGNTRLRGKIGIGNVEKSLAHQSWELDESEDMDFDGFLVSLHNSTVRHTPLEDLTRDFVIELDGTTAFSSVLSQGNRQVILAEDLNKNLPFAFQSRFGPGVCAVLPFRAGKSVIGLVVVDNKHDGKPISGALLNRLETFMNIAGLVWQNLSQRKQREALLEAAHVILGKASQQPLKETISKICESARTVTGADLVVVYPLKSGGEPYIYDVKNIARAGQFIQGKIKEKPRQTGVSASILRSGTLVVEDVSQENSAKGTGWLDRHPFIQREGIHALIGTPIRGIEKGEELGVLYLNFHSSQSFTTQDIIQAETFANLVSIAILNARQAEEVRQSLSEALIRGQASQRELIILRRVLTAALVNGSEPEVIKTLLTNVRQVLNRPDLNPALILRKWEAASLDDEPLEKYISYSLNSEGVLTQEDSSDENGVLVRRALSGIHQRTTKSERKLFVPIRIGETAIGVLYVRLGNTAFVRESEDVLGRFASVAGLALDNIRRQEHLLSVLQATKVVTAPINLVQTFEAIVRTVRQVSPDLSVLTLWYSDPESERIKSGIYFGLRGEIKPEVEEPPATSIVWKVMSEPGPVWCDKVRRHPLLSGRFARDEGIISAAAFPLRADGEEVGAMFFNYRRMHLFTLEEKTIFTILAEVVATSIREAVHLEAIRRKTLRLDAALKTSEAIGTALDLNQLLQKVLASLVSSFKDTTPCVFIYNKDDSLLEFAPASMEFYHIEDPEFSDLRALQLNGSSIASRVARRALQERKVVCENILDVYNDPDYFPLIYSTKAELSISLVSNSELLGVLVLERSGAHKFDQDDEELARAVAQQISVAIDRAQQSARLNFSRSVATITAWAADIAHEVNREVGTIRNCAYLIREKAIYPDEIQKYADMIEESAASLSLASSRQPEPQPITLDAAITHWVTEFVKKRKEKVDVKFDLHCGDVTLYGDPIFLQRTLRHLTRNAAQAMDKEQERQLVVHTFLAENNSVEIIFEDSGPGVDVRVRPEILQQPVSTKGYPGGYGLLLARQMVEDMGGTIRLMPSHPGTGAIFSIKLPLNPGNQNAWVEEAVISL
jgi:GAF domain-containing protein/DNA-binding response OmpR family regulator